MFNLQSGNSIESSYSKMKTMGIELDRCKAIKIHTGVQYKSQCVCSERT